MLLLLLLFLLSVDTGAKLYSSDTFTLDWTAVQQHPCVFIDSDKWATTTQSFSYTHSGPRESGLIGDKVMSRQLVGSLVSQSICERAPTRIHNVFSGVEKQQPLMPLNS